MGENENVERWDENERERVLQFTREVNRMIKKKNAVCLSLSLSLSRACRSEGNHYFIITGCCEEA